MLSIKNIALYYAITSRRRKSTLCARVFHPVTAAPPSYYILYMYIYIVNRVSHTYRRRNVVLPPVSKVFVSARVRPITNIISRAKHTQVVVEYGRIRFEYTHYSLDIKFRAQKTRMRRPLRTFVSGERYC